MRLPTNLLRAGGHLDTTAARSFYAAAARWRRAASTSAPLYFQSDAVPRSIRTTGLVGTSRDLDGSDGEFFGVDPRPILTHIEDGRGRGMRLDENGFCLVGHPLNHIDYYDNSAVLDSYYAECEALVKRETGASRVLGFDHNLRSRARKRAAERLRGGNAVQEPLVTYGVHNDYTLDSAPRRIEQLARPLGANDTLRSGADAPLPIDPGELDGLLRGRWMFVNVWRNVASSPVQSSPLALCDAATVSVEDLVVFEIRYADRVGENYFARATAAQRWYHFPAMTRDEAVLIKCWDSRGADFLGKLEAARGYPSPPRGAAAVPATFSLHSGFDDPAAPPGAPARESIEVRCVAFFGEGSG